MRVVADKLTVSFPASDGGLLAALGPVSFTVETGSFVSLVGPSGCGKSTLVRVIGGLLSASSGKVWINDHAVDRPLSEVGFMFQDANLMPWRTVQDNIALPLELVGIAKQARYQQTRSLLPALGLEGFGDMYPGELSGGMAQRVALGRVLVQRPELVLLDEPFGALDAMTRERISIDLLRLWAKFRQTVLMVTHDINEAVLLSDRIIVLSRRPGRIIADIEVTLERPRSVEMIYTPEFSQIAREVRSTIDRA